MRAPILISLLSMMLYAIPASAAVTMSHPISAQWAFTRAGQHPDQLLESTFADAHHTLDIAVYSLTDYGIVDAIVAAKKRGVDVRIITDREESRQWYEARELRYLAEYHIPIKINTHSGLMHLKVSIVDDRVVTTGSYNYSEDASTRNDEVLVVLRDSAMAKAWETEFNAMWTGPGYTTWIA